MARFASRAGSKRRLFVALALMLAFLPLALGCSSFDSISRKTERFTKRTAKRIKTIGKLSFIDKGIQRKVAVVAMTDRTGFQHRDVAGLFQDHLVTYLKEKCADTLWVAPGDPAYPAEVAVLPTEAETGRVDNFKLVEAGRRLGLNTILTGTVIDIHQYADQRGIIWWRDTRHFLQVLVNIEAWDTATAAKLVDESYLYETELEHIDPDEPDKPVAEQPDLVPIVEGAIRDAADFLGIDVCEAVRDQPWTGYVTAVTPDGAEISSGSEVGLAQGRVLEVFQKGTIVVGAFGERFYKPGVKMGEARITAIDAGRARVALDPGLGVEIGTPIRPK